MILVEWLTFLATHSIGSNWKATDDDFPYVCKLVMAKSKFLTILILCCFIVKNLSLKEQNFSFVVFEK